MSGLDQNAPPDHFKMTADRALSTGRSLQIAQTGFVHYFHGDAPGGVHHTIPIYENLLFVLALLNSRLTENVLEAKVLLDRLISFQNVDTGLFARYLHEYPSGRHPDPGAGLSLLVPLYRIVKVYGHVLGVDLKAKCENVSMRLLNVYEDDETIREFPYFLTVRLAALRVGFGKLSGDPELLRRGFEELEKPDGVQPDRLKSTVEIGETIASLQIVYPSIALSPWNAFWKMIEETWHESTGCYVGPSSRERQFREEPAPDLYDLYLSCFSGRFPARISSPGIYRLKGALIQATHDTFTSPMMPYRLNGTSDGVKRESIVEPNAAFTYLEKSGRTDPSADQTFTPFRAIWGDLHRVHSLVCQGGSYRRVDYRLSEKTAELSFVFDPIPAEEKRDEKREIEFFIDVHPEVTLESSGRRVNTFRFGEEVMLTSAGIRFSFVFILEEGEGDFFGHFFRGNCPSQTDCKGENRFHSYDWTLFLRSVRRSGPCKIRAVITRLEAALQNS